MRLGWQIELAIGLVAGLLPAPLVVDKVPERDVLAAFRQKQIACPERGPDREGKRNFPNAPVNLSVLYQKWTPSGGNEALRIISFDPLACAGIKIAQDTDRRNQAFAADRGLQRKSHEDWKVLAQCPVPG
jgi:hypothetical protein